jgi:hypothetical protein
MRMSLTETAIKNHEELWPEYQSKAKQIVLQVISSKKIKVERSCLL